IWRTGIWRTGIWRTGVLLTCVRARVGGIMTSRTGLPGAALVIRTRRLARAALACDAVGSAICLVVSRIVHMCQRLAYTLGTADDQLGRCGALGAQGFVQGFDIVFKLRDALLRVFYAFAGSQGIIGSITSTGNSRILPAGQAQLVASRGIRFRSGGYRSTDDAACGAA